MAAGLCALAACGPVGLRSSPIPTARPAVPVVAPPVAAPVQPSETSRALRDFYGRIQQNYLTQGLLRVDGGGPDTPFTERQLVENFIRIALFEEFTNLGNQLVRRETETQLHRWDGPIRMKLEFGDSVPAAQRAKDTQAVANYVARLARLTGLTITLTSNTPNYFVFFVNEDERQTIGPQLRAISPDVDMTAVNTVQNMPRSTLCLVFAVDGPVNGVYAKAASVIRTEHPDLLRLSCIHEELAQGLGLPNDSPAARPSIFNDDEEFGLLTTHDEYLLRMLYDPRMRPGMTATQARPIAQQIAQELLGGES
jgi:hypothetical protein